MAEQPDNPGITDPGPGVHVVVHADPLRTGRAIAQVIDGVLIDLPQMAEATIAQRAQLPEARAARQRLDELEEAARGLAGGHYELDRELLDRRDDLQRLAQRRVLDDATGDRLLKLCHDLAGLEASLERSRGSTQQPGHAPTEPDRSKALRAAAAGVRAEEAAVVDAQLSLALLPTDVDAAGEEVGRAVEAEEMTDPEPTDAAEAEAETPQALEAPDIEDNEDDLVEPEAQPEAAGAPVDEDDDGMAELWHPERLAGRRSENDGSVLMPIGILLIGLFVTCIVLLTGLPKAVPGAVFGLAIVAAGIARYSIKSEARERAATKANADADDGDGDDADSDADGDSDAGNDADGGSSEADDDGAEPVRDEPASEEQGPEPESVAEEPSVPAEPAPVGELARRTKAHADAEARLAAARRAWESIAGVDADPHDPAYQARAGEHAEDAEASPAVRALAAVHRQAEDEWTTIWGELGRTAPPPDESVVELMLADLHETAPDPGEAAAMLEEADAAERRLRQREMLAEAFDSAELETLRASAPDDDALDDRPLVLVRPFEGLTNKPRKRMRTRLNHLPADLTVVILVADESEVPPASGSPAPKRA